ncbi:hypothetical protein F4780DRAFT_142103 [Xylariomycetidae sp. FL0641]|nr:hypothetical protein F4780DRAFT_142103 [Xylariomycetidae sp. FL0641]
MALASGSGRCGSEPFRLRLSISHLSGFQQQSVPAFITHSFIPLHYRLVEVASRSQARFEQLIAGFWSQESPADATLPALVQFPAHRDWSDVIFPISGDEYRDPRSPTQPSQPTCQPSLPVCQYHRLRTALPAYLGQVARNLPRRGAGGPLSGPIIVPVAALSRIAWKLMHVRPASRTDNSSIAEAIQQPTCSLGVRTSLRCHRS